MKSLRGYDWQLSDAGRGYRLSDEFEFDESEKVIGFKQELLSALAVAGLVLVAFALL
jgi:hypothetical protein